MLNNNHLHLVLKFSFEMIIVIVIHFLISVHHIPVAKKRSLFDDSHDSEIQELTGIIRHDLSSLTKQLGDLRNRSIAASQGGNSAHLQKHSSNLVGTLQTKVAVITQKFKDVLEVRTEVSELISLYTSLFT